MAETPATAKAKPEPKAPEAPTASEEPERQYGPMTARQSITEVMRLVQAVAKSQYNEHNKYNFRGVDAVYNAVGPALRQVGAVVLPDVVKVKRRETKTSGGKDTMETMVKVRIRWFGTDGGEPETTMMWAESLESSDKGLAQAISVAMRTYFINTLVIPTGDTDPDEQPHEERGPAQPRQRAPRTSANAKAKTPTDTISSLQSEIYMLQAGKSPQAIQDEVFQWLGIETPAQVTVDGLRDYRNHLMDTKAQAQAAAAAAEQPAVAGGEQAAARPAQPAEAPAPLANTTETGEPQ